MRTGPASPDRRVASGAAALAARYGIAMAAADIDVRRVAQSRAAGRAMVRRARRRRRRRRPVARPSRRKRHRLADCDSCTRVVAADDCAARVDRPRFAGERRVRARLPVVGAGAMARARRASRPSTVRSAISTGPSALENGSPRSAGSRSAGLDAVSHERARSRPRPETARGRVYFKGLVRPTRGGSGRHADACRDWRRSRSRERSRWSTRSTESCGG